MIFMWNFTYDADDKEWVGGSIYDAESGNTYSAYMSLQDYNTMNLRGYLGLSIFGRTNVWKRGE